MYIYIYYTCIISTTHLFTHSSFISSLPLHDSQKIVIFKIFWWWFISRIFVNLFLVYILFVLLSPWRIQRPWRAITRLGYRLPEDAAVWVSTSSPFIPSTSTTLLYWKTEFSGLERFIYGFSCWMKLKDELTTVILNSFLWTHLCFNPFQARMVATALQ